jgi:hypothetical protein
MRCRGPFSAAHSLEYGGLFLMVFGGIYVTVAAISSVNNKDAANAAHFSVAAGIEVVGVFLASAGCYVRKRANNARLAGDANLSGDSRVRSTSDHDSQAPVSPATRLHCIGYLPQAAPPPYPAIGTSPRVPHEAALPPYSEIDPLAPSYVTISRPSDTPPPVDAVQPNSQVTEMYRDAACTTAALFAL